MVTFHPNHPKWDQNLQFTPQSKTTSILVTFIWESPGAKTFPSTLYFVIEGQNARDQIALHAVLVSKQSGD